MWKVNARLLDRPKKGAEKICIFWWGILWLLVDASTISAHMQIAQ
jgi:hypothetical protein